MDVGGWLRGLGLGQYEEKFRDNKIDADLLPRLTVDDLKDIGVSVVGDRRRLLDAIAVIAGAGPPADVPTSPTRSAPSEGLLASAERRPITVMFCDLVGSTSLAAKLDAEDWRNLVNAYLDEATKAVTGLGGHVLKRLGDGLMALFGYPQAQENDAERAVRAALAIQRALADLNARNARSGAPELSARIGIECGSVVVDANGEVFGEAPNVAARVQAAAEPGSVLITGSVQRQVAGLFVVEEKGARELKGVAQPLSLYRVVRASGGGRRGGARALTPLVGREGDLDHLSRRWERTRKGEGQLVLVIGEPGIGKSRLIEEFHARLAETPHSWVEWSASQLLQNTPLHPIAEWGRQRFGVDVPAEQRLADLEGTLRLIGLDPAEYAPLLAPLVDIPLPSARAANLPPEELRRRQLAAMTAWVLAGARSQPVVLAFEDLHWADPTSLDLLRAFADRGAQAPMLLLATTRPEFRPDWSVRSHHSLISLSPLDRAQVAHMVSEISARHALSKELIEGVSERTGGVPLFVEEVTRLLVERGAQGGVQAIPPTLQQSLAARLDRLGPAREIAQIGAVLGRDFGYSLLRDVAEMDEQALQASLDRLADADLLFVEGAPPQANYRFKHALIQDAAYDSLLKSRRQGLHRRAADVLVEAKAEPEAIAHHFTEAGLDDAAIEWWGKAGDQALRRSAFQEAIAHLGKAIAMADKAVGPVTSRAGDEAPSHRRVKLQTDYGQAVMWSKGFAAEETKAAFARATELAAKSDDFSERFAAAHGQWTMARVRGELRSARELTSAFLREAEEAGRVTEAGVARRGLALISYLHGDFVEARTHCERALAISDPEHEEEARERYGEYTGTVATACLAVTTWHLGEVERARELIETANRRATELGHPPSMAGQLFQRCELEILRGDAAAALSAAKALEALSREHGLALFRLWAELFTAWAQGRLHDPSAAAAELRQALATLTDQGQMLAAPIFYALLAQLEAETLGAERALARIDEALALAQQIEQRCNLVFMYRLRGEILLKRDPNNPAPAEDSFKTAIGIAKDQGARSLGLQAAFALAKLFQATARPVEAQAVLAPALEGFSPTPEMPEIAEAQELLSALSKNDEVKAEAARRQRLTQLHAARGVALFAARGGGAPETTAAFASAREQTFGDAATSERFVADFGLWVGSYVRGELPSMRAHAAAFLNDVAARPDSPEAGVAHRTAGITCWFAGEYREARDHLERALALFEPGRDDDLTFRFGLDPGIATMVNLANASWPLGEVGRAISLIDRAQLRSADFTHAGVLAFARMHSALFDLMRRDHVRAAPKASELAQLAREHELTMYGAFGAFLKSWATDAGGAPGDGLGDMRRAVEELREQNVLLFDGLLKIALAEAEARAGDAARAIAILDEALATSNTTGYRAFDAELHRVRGDLLLKRDPANPAPSQDAFLTAIAVAKRQGTRSFELRAALALAKLYQSTGRPVEAHTVLAPALEAFSPTPELPEIAEAEALLTALKETDEVKAEAARRQRRQRLQVTYGNALIAARGFGAPETTEAFAIARELAHGDNAAPERLAADYGLWASSYVRGELASMRTHAAAFLAGVSARPNSAEAGVAHRVQGITHYFAGEYVEALHELERALALFQPGRDDDLAFRFSPDSGVAAMIYLALVSWPLGEVGRAVSLVDRMKTRIAGLSHATTLAHGALLAAFFALMRGDRPGARTSTHELARVVREHDLALFRAGGEFLIGWATADGGAPGEGLAAMRRGAESLSQQNALVFDGIIKIALAEGEAGAGDPDRAIAILDEALATVDRIGYRAFEAELSCTRGETLLKRDAANADPAEEAFRTALSVAREQGARSFGLRAALSLAKLYQSTGRPAEAHAVLEPALQGFSSTPEMPEIAQAQTLLAAIEASAHVRHE